MAGQHNIHVPVVLLLCLLGLLLRCSLQEAAALAG
jgi:hypothetical protein